MRGNVPTRPGAGAPARGEGDPFTSLRRREERLFGQVMGGFGAGAG